MLLSLNFKIYFISGIHKRKGICMKSNKKIVLAFIVVLYVILTNGCLKLNVNFDVDSKTKSLEDSVRSMMAISDSENQLPNIDIVVTEKVEYVDEENGKTYNKASYDKIVMPQRFINAHSKLSKEIEKFNNDNDVAAREFIESNKTEIRNMIKERNEPELELSSSNTVNICRNDDKVFSFIYEVTSYTGGAHGNYGAICYNFNPQNGFKYKNSDVFTDIKKVHNAVLEKLDKYEYKDSLFPDYKDILTDIFNMNDDFNLNIKEKSVDMIFDPYILGPWAAGTITVTFDLDKDKELLNNNLFY